MEEYSANSFKTSCQQHSIGLFDQPDTLPPLQSCNSARMWVFFSRVACVMLFSFLSFTLSLFHFRPRCASAEVGKYALSRVRVRVRVPTPRVRVRVRVPTPRVRVRVRVPTPRVRVRVRVPTPRVRIRVQVQRNFRSEQELQIKLLKNACFSCSV